VTVGDAGSAASRGAGCYGAGARTQNHVRDLDVSLNVIGADIVEVAPAYDHAEITGIAAAHVGYELLSVLAHNRGGPR
jgi:agmatinase